VCAVVISLSGCKDSPDSDSAPVITDVKISSSNDILGPVWVTTLTAGQKYYAYIFAADEDLDVTQIVLTSPIGTQTIPVLIGQGAVVDTFLCEILAPSSPGILTYSLYLVDGKGNKSDTWSGTVTVQ
jgi:hypothetical protein